MRDSRTQAWAAIVGGALMVVGSFLPWATLFGAISISGVEGDIRGYFSLGLGLIAGFVGFAMLKKVSRVASGILVSVGLAGAVVFVTDFVEIQAIASVGIGLWVVGAGAMLAGVAGITGFMATSEPRTASRPKIAPPQTPRKPPRPPAASTRSSTASAAAPEAARTTKQPSADPAVRAPQSEAAASELHVQSGTGSAPEGSPKPAPVGISRKPSVTAGGPEGGSFVLTMGLNPAPTEEWQEMFHEEAQSRSIDAEVNGPQLVVRISPGGDVSDLLSSITGTVVATNNARTQQWLEERDRVGEAEREAEGEIEAIDAAISSWWSENQPVQSRFMYCEGCRLVLSPSIAAKSHSGHLVRDYVQAELAEFEALEKSFREQWEREQRGDDGVDAEKGV